MFTEYTGNRQFDLQLNRTFAPILDRPGMDKVAATTLPRLRTTKKITALAQHLADRFESEWDADAAWRLYELAAFYLGPTTPVSIASSTRCHVLSTRPTKASRSPGTRFPIAVGS